jgi:glycerol uptake facilitator-like aquaporin
MYSHLAEFFGTLFFVYVTLATGNPLAIGTSLALVLILTTGFNNVTVNPTVTITLAAAGKIKPREILPRCIIQVLAGLVAFELYKRFGV